VDGRKTGCRVCDAGRVDLVASLPAFLVAVALISASPGPAMALITRRAALQGTRAAVPTILGLETGLYIWALAAGAGLAALVAASETAYLVLRIVGAAVLIGLGLRAWRTAWVDRGEAGPPAYPAASRRSTWFAFGEGAMVQLANPKAAVFMFAFYPQFVPADQPLLQTTAALAVMPGQVVQSADGRCLSDRGVVPVVIVEVDPGR
jgi:threonine/homoserine/homoserine lactone efflux protein